MEHSPKHAVNTQAIKVEGSLPPVTQNTMKIATVKQKRKIPIVIITFFKKSSFFINKMSVYGILSKLFQK